MSETSRDAKNASVPIRYPASAGLTLQLCLARFAFDGPVNLPVTDTLPLAESFRRELLRHCRSVLALPPGDPGKAELCQRCPSVTGKTADGQPLRGHAHAFFLPTDEDGDGRIDHVTVVAGQGFRADEVRALDRLRQVRHGDGDPLRLLLVGLGGARELPAPLFAESAVWVSATPFVATRYPKRRGVKRDLSDQYATPLVFAQHVLGQELDRLRERRPDLPPVERLDPLQEGIGPGRLRPIQFQRFRQKPGDDGGRRPAGAFRIVFATPARGQLCLGHSCHFGLGLFVPAEERRGADPRGSDALLVDPRASR